jgi:uncharacterized membrane protein YedE/YeeE
MDLDASGHALVGGALIGAAASLLLAANGRVAGISGIALGLLTPTRGEVRWRVAFVVGLLAAGALTAAALPGQVGRSPRALPWVVVAGLLVGVGTRLGNGCTSGHGVCGVARRSPRSIVATATFMATGVVTAVLARLLGGAS